MTAHEQNNIEPRSLSPEELDANDLRRVVGAARAYLHLPDLTYLVAALGAAATTNLDGPPAWLLLVGPPSCGKTEIVNLLVKVADEHLDELTTPGLLHWSSGPSPRPEGILTRLPPKGLATFGDCSSLLASSDRGGREHLFGTLRRVFDGMVTRDIAPRGNVRPSGPQQLRWEGRLTVVAAVTGVIDLYAAHSDALGARWIYLRLPERSFMDKRAAQQLATQSQNHEARALAQDLAQSLLDRSDATTAIISPRVQETIADLSLVTAIGRAAVPRTGSGSREIVGQASVEEPMRVNNQLSTLAKGLISIGLAEDGVLHVLRRVALDSMPATRLSVLEALCQLGNAETASNTQVAEWARLDRKVARRELEDLQAAGATRDESWDSRSDVNDYDNSVRRTGKAEWHITGEYTDYIRRAIGNATPSTWTDAWLQPQGVNKPSRANITLVDDSDETSGA